jgi:two-component system, chemotaxis family, protein-glutamate methylesterase/glutaminase
MSFSPAPIFGDLGRRKWFIPPRPVVMVSARNESGSDSARLAIELGAIDFIEKPNAGSQTMESFAEALTQCLLGRAGSNGRQPVGAAARAPRRGPEGRHQPTLLVVGASTGGVQALGRLMQGMAGFPLPIVVTQHMPAGFTDRLAYSLSQASRLPAGEASHGDRLRPGRIVIAPGGHHLMIGRDAGGLFCILSDDDPVSGHRPSVDRLFQSSAEALGANAIGVLLTGMGRDGADGLRALHDAGAYTICQDEATCVVFGMPRAAIEQGAADEVLPLHHIAGRLMQLCARPALSA